MNLVRRGTVGVALFVSGVLSIPAVMMADGNAGNAEGDAALSTTPSTGSTTTAAGPSGAWDRVAGTPSPTLSSRSGSAFAAPGSAAGAAPGSAAGAALAKESTRAGSGQSPTSPTAGTAKAAVLGFNGVNDGGVLSGRVQIHALVTGSMKVVQFSLSGPTSMSYLSIGQPFLFAPDALSLDTTQLPNGPYTLTATPYDPSAGRPLSVDFQIANPTSSVVSQPLLNNQTVSYYTR